MQDLRAGGGWLQFYTGCSGKASLGRRQFSRNLKEELGETVPGRGTGKGSKDSAAVLKKQRWSQGNGRTSHRMGWLGSPRSDLVCSCKVLLRVRWEAMGGFEERGDMI